MTWLWERGPCRTVLTAFILQLSVDGVAAEYDALTWTYYFFRIGIPVILIALLITGCCCRRRRNRRIAEQAAREGSGNQAGWGWGQGTGTQPADGQTPPYFISNGAYTGPPSHSYATNYNTVFTGSHPTDANKTGPEFTGDLSAPPPSYEDVRLSKLTTRPLRSPPVMEPIPRPQLADTRQITTLDRIHQSQTRPTRTSKGTSLPHRRDS